jgi:putative acetyltransferase
MMTLPPIRPYRDSDRAAVLSLFTEVNRALAPPDRAAAFDAYIERSIREELGRIPDYYAGPRAGFWVCFGGATLAGMFGLEPAGDDAVELRRMYVAPAWRRRGLARAMLAHAEQAARDAGCRRMVLSTSELQQAALGLYRASGYRQTHEEIAEAASNKTVGGGLRRFAFEKVLA